MKYDTALEMKRFLSEINKLKKISSLENNPLDQIGFDVLKSFEILFGREKVPKNYWKNIIKDKDVYKIGTSSNKRLATLVSNTLYHILARTGRVKSDQYRAYEEYVEDFKNRKSAQGSEFSGKRIDFEWDNYISGSMYRAARHQNSDHLRDVEGAVRDLDEAIRDSHLTHGDQMWRQVTLKAHNVSIDFYAKHIKEEAKKILDENGLNESASKEEINRLIEKFKLNRSKDSDNSIYFLMMFLRVDEFVKVNSHKKHLNKNTYYRDPHSEGKIDDFLRGTRRSSLGSAIKKDKNETGRYKLYLTYDFESDYKSIEGGFKGLELCIQNIIVALSRPRIKDQFEKGVALKSHADGSEIIKHLDSIVVYCYTEEDRNVAYREIERLTPKLNEKIKNSKDMSGRLLPSSDRANKYMRSHLGNDGSKSEVDGSDTSLFCAFAATFLMQNIITYANIENVNSIEEFANILTRRVKELYENHWSRYTYAEKMSVSKKVKNYMTL